MVITRSARRETVAAFTAVAILAPETVASAQIAGIPPAGGLAAAPLCVLAYAVLGQSRRLIVGATAATAVISSAAVLGLSIVTGTILILTGLLRCGFVARFLTPEALQGFLFGLAVVIIVRQLAVIVDVHTRTEDVLVRAWDIAAARTDWSMPSLATGLVCLLSLVVLEMWVPKIPATIAVLIVASLTYAGLHLQRHGVQHVVDVPAGLPRLALPEISAGQWFGLVPTAAGLARPDHGGYLLVLDLGASFELRSAVVDALEEVRLRVDARGRQLRLVHLYLAAQDAISAGPLADVPAFRTLDEAVLPAESEAPEDHNEYVPG